MRSASLAAMCPIIMMRLVLIAVGWQISDYLTLHASYVAAAVTE